MGFAADDVEEKGKKQSKYNERQRKQGARPQRDLHPPAGFRRNRCSFRTHLRMAEQLRLAIGVALGTFAQRSILGAERQRAQPPLEAARSRRRKRSQKKIARPDTCQTSGLEQAIRLRRPQEVHIFVERAAKHG